MENKNRKDELQSRRDFFKKAAKMSLPVIGAIVFAKPFSISSIATTTSSSCDYTCEVSCADDCYGHCKYGCKTTCSGTCDGSCKNTCYYSNK